MRGGFVFRRCYLPFPVCRIRTSLRLMIIMGMPSLFPRIFEQKIREIKGKIERGVFFRKLFIFAQLIITLENMNTEQLQPAIYEIVKLIPSGRATSYGAIAKAIGFPNLSRMVGQIMSQCNSEVSYIPAHRVVNSSGILSAKDAFGTSGQMQQLLESEGIIVKNDRIQNWKNVFWNPLIEL